MLSASGSAAAAAKIKLPVLLLLLELLITSGQLPRFHIIHHIIVKDVYQTQIIVDYYQKISRQLFMM